jgi:hypothetical protein
MFLLSSVGFTIIVTKGTIFLPVRNKLKWKLINCPLCFGFWSGIIFYFLMNFGIMPDTLKIGVDMVIHGFSAAISSWVIWTAFGGE